jgi:hypothetical protein
MDFTLKRKWIEQLICERVYRNCFQTVKGYESTPLLNVVGGCNLFACKN